MTVDVFSSSLHEHPGTYTDSAYAPSRAEPTPSIADTDTPDSAWRRLRTFEGDPLPEVTAQLVIRIRSAFGEQDALTTEELLAALNERFACKLERKGLARLLAPAGIVPLSIGIGDGRAVNGYRRGWFAGYFEQLEGSRSETVVDCGKESHKGGLCRLADGGGPWQCGICHPPVSSLDVVWAVAAGK